MKKNECGLLRLIKYNVGELEKHKNMIERKAEEKKYKYVLMEE